jgi:hypothetical protein
LRQLLLLLLLFALRGTAHHTDVNTNVVAVALQWQCRSTLSFGGICDDWLLLLNNSFI